MSDVVLLLLEAPSLPSASQEPQYGVTTAWSFTSVGSISGHPLPPSLALISEAPPSLVKSL